MNQTEQERLTKLEYEKRITGLKSDLLDAQATLESLERNLERHTRESVDEIHGLEATVKEADDLLDKKEEEILHLRRERNLCAVKYGQKKRQCKRLIQLFVKMSKTDPR